MLTCRRVSFAWPLALALAGAGVVVGCTHDSTRQALGTTGTLVVSNTTSGDDQPEGPYDVGTSVPAGNAVVLRTTDGGTWDELSSFPAAAGCCNDVFFVDAYDDGSGTVEAVMLPRAPSN
jgi:hypothetical protein